MPARVSSVSYRPAMAWFAAVGAGWVFVLVMLGAFTTSIGAGMVFQDWPLSNGSLNPAGWLANAAMFAEHSHRLSAGMMSAITIALAVWLSWRETRPWLRRLGWTAVALVLVQAVVGGLRVLLDRQQLPMVDTSLGRLFAMLHACLAQVFACTLIAVAAALSRPWVEPVRREPRRGDAWLRRQGLACCALLLAQTAIAAVMRHSFAGLAIPTFPFTPEGGLVPAYWDFPIGINFAHRAMALVVTIAAVWFAATSLRARETGPGAKVLAVAIVALLPAQVALGASIVWTGRNPYVATAHVLLGAVTLAATFLLTWVAHRDVLESAPETAATVPLPGAVGGKPVPA